MTRRDIEATIERLIDLLDAMDGDPDMEPDFDDERDHDAEGDTWSDAPWPFARKA